jgi:ubiquinone/menaquinone biosynthesis C-methylase UbiE
VTTSRLTKFYGALSPTLDTIVKVLSAAGVDTDHVQSRDLYERDLDCHNLGMHAMLEFIAEAVDEYGAPASGDVVLDVGCGLGGPGRFIVDRFGPAVVGIDLLPLRIELAQGLAELTRTTERVSYRVADATNLEMEEASFSQVWMLDVGIHIRDKQALFGELARVLRPGGLLVMHDQTGPLPPAAQFPAKRQAPYVAPSLVQLIRHVENAGMRMLTWRDSTDRVLDYFRGLRALLPDGPDGEGVPGRALLEGYIETLANLGGRTGLLIARRIPT